jgi:hypothetical protein
MELKNFTSAMKQIDEMITTAECNRLATLIDEERNGTMKREE